MEAWSTIAAPTSTAESNQRRWLPAALGLGGGLLTALATPPWGWWPAGIVGLGVLAAALVQRSSGGQGLRWRARGVVGFAFGMAMFGVTLFWMSEFHAVGYGAAVIGYALFYGGAVACVPVRRSPAAVAVLPAALVVVEWIRDRFPFGGVPLGSIEIGQAGGPLASAARVFGPLALLGLAAALGTALAWSVRALQEGQGARSGIPAAAVVATAALLVAAAAIAPRGGPDAGSARVAVVQGGGVRGLRAVFSDRDDVFQRHAMVSAELGRPVDLVLWPENAIDVAAISGSEPDRVLSGLAARLDATVVAGVTEDAAEDRFVNVAYAWGPDGDITDGTTKVKRVPFGEYVPGRALFERLVDLSILPRDAEAGRGPGVLRTPAGRFGVAISYEVFFADRARDAARAGASALLVPTNAASFTTSQVPTQQVAAARLRAIETGRWVVQAAPTGYSAVIDPSGTVVERSVLGQAQTLSATIARRHGATLYVRWGDAPLVLAAAGLVLASQGRPRRRPATNRTSRT